MRCLVTGGLGFIGSHLVRRLKELGHSVVIFDDYSAPALSEYEAGVSVVDVDVHDICGTMLRGVDQVFHLAATSRTQAAIANPYDCHTVNASGSLCLLSAIKLDCPKARVVLASSNIVYGSPNPYKASKLAMEEYMHAYNSCYGLNCIALRYSNVYGPGMRWDDPICLAAMRRSKYEKGYIELTGDGKQSRDFTHVLDIVEGTIAAAQSDYKGVLDLTSEEHLSMWDAASYFGCEVRRIPARIGDTPEIRQSAAAARELFGWKAKVKFQDGIKDVLAEVPVEVHA